MSEEKKKSNKKSKKMSRGAKIYTFTCLLSMVIGILSLYFARNFMLNTLESSEKTVLLPSYEKIIAENEKLTEIMDVQSETPVVKTPEPVENTEEESIYEESVKVVSDAVYKTEKVFHFTVPCDGEILKKFSLDKPLKSRTLGDFRTHSGIDIKADAGTAVSAAEDGVVENIYEDNLLGITIVIAHSESLKTEYSNMAGDDMVKVGMEIKKGQAIGCVGNTAKGELLDEAHLHFAVLENGNYINPENVIKGY